MKEQTLKTIQSYYHSDDPSHDWNHILRVVNTCKKFGEELGADLNLLIPAAYLHDIINLPKNDKNRSEASKLAAMKAKEILKDEVFSEIQIEKICLTIKEHSFSAGLKATTIESQILQDADRLDAMGAIGVMRWTTCGTLMGAQYYHQDDPWGDSRDLDDKKYSLDHFENKLLRLKDMLNTKPAQREGERRHEFFLSFLSTLKNEINL